MGLENLSSVFSDISQNTLDRVDKANSIVNDKLDNNEFGAYSETPIKDSVFANKSLQLKSGQSLIEGNEHTFGTQNRNDDLIYIDKIERGQIESPIAKTVTNGTTTLDKKGGDAKLDLYGGYSGNVIDPKIRKKELNIEIGKNNRLGIGDFVFDTLYNVNHTAKLDRKLIDTGRTDENGNKIVINTLESTIGQAWSNMDIRSAPDGLRGNEPYIVNEIGSVEGGVIQFGNNRDVLPFKQSLDDISRLVKFNTSLAGIANLGKEIVTGAYFSTLGTISPNNIWGGYPTGMNNPISFIKNKIKEVVKDKVLSAANTSNARLLATNIFIPPIPTPVYGNTGFLNFVNSATQSLGGRGSIRRPGTLAFEYSTIVKSGVEEFSKIFQMGLLIDAEQTLSVQRINFSVGRNKVTESELTKNPLISSDAVPAIFVTKSTAQSTQKLPFNNLREVDIVGNLGTNDAIAKSKILNEIPISLDAPLEKSTDIPKPNDFYVRIKDLRDNKFIYFRGFVTGITENANPSFTSTNYIGRSEPVYLYERGDRDLSFTLRLYPNNRDELESMYEKMDRLTSLAYPQYQKEENDSTISRMKAPFTELYMAHIGDRVKGQFGFIKSLSYTVGESGDWDADTNLPKLIDVAISYQILNKKPPQLGDKFYGFNFDRVI